MVDLGRAVLLSSVVAGSTFSMSDIDAQCACLLGCGLGDDVDGCMAAVERVPLVWTVVEDSAVDWPIRRDDAVTSGARESVASLIAAVWRIWATGAEVLGIG